MIQIRRLHPEDVEAVLAITAESPEAAGWNRRAYEDILVNPDRGRCLVAEQEGLLVGFACFRVMGSEAELLNLAVLPSLRRQGAGSLLMEQVLQEVAKSGAVRIFLEVRDSNRAAIGFYERFGFEPIARRPGYYIHPQADALTLHRRIPSPAGSCG